MSMAGIIRAWFYGNVIWKQQRMLTYFHVGFLLPFVWKATLQKTLGFLSC